MQLRLEDSVDIIHGDSMHVPLCEAMVVDGFVLGDSVIPKSDGVGFPTKSAGVFRLGRMGVEHLQDGFALPGVHVDDVGGE